MKRTTNTISKPAFVFKNIFWLLLPYFVYRLILFRPLPGKTYADSKELLWKLMIILPVVGICLAWERHRDHMRIFVNASLPYGIYTVWANRRDLMNLLIAFGVIAGVCCVGFAVLRLSRKIRQPQYRRIILRERLRQTLWGSRIILCAALSVLMVSLFASVVFGFSLIPKKTPAVIASGDGEYTIDLQIQTLGNLREGVWETLPTAEKLETLQVVANIEGQHLGLPTELNVILSPNDETTIASYSDREHTIRINPDYLEKMPGEEMLESVCHEAQHAYQWRLVDTMDDLTDDHRNLYIFQRAARYEQEFTNYTKGKEDIFGYYSQLCEIDAREYQYERSYAYRRAIRAFYHIEDEESFGY